MVGGAGVSLDEGLREGRLFDEELTAGDQDINDESPELGAVEQHLCTRFLQCT
jgi:hypothetical protein